MNFMLTRIDPLFRIMTLICPKWLYEASYRVFLYVSESTVDTVRPVPAPFSVMLRRYGAVVAAVLIFVLSFTGTEFYYLTQDLVDPTRSGGRSDQP